MSWKFTPEDFLFSDDYHPEQNKLFMAYFMEYKEY